MHGGVDEAHGARGGVEEIEVEPVLGEGGGGSSGVGRRTSSSDRSIAWGPASAEHHGPAVALSVPALWVPALSEQATFVEPRVGGPGYARRLVTVDDRASTATASCVPPPKGRSGSRGCALVRARAGGAGERQCAICQAPRRASEGCLTGAGPDRWPGLRGPGSKARPIAIRRSAAVATRFPVDAASRPFELGSHASAVGYPADLPADGSKAGDLGADGIGTRDGEERPQTGGQAPRRVRHVAASSSTGSPSSKEAAMGPRVMREPGRPASPA